MELNNMRNYSDYVEQRVIEKVTVKYLDNMIMKFNLANNEAMDLLGLEDEQRITHREFLESNGL